MLVCPMSLIVQRTVLWNVHPYRVAVESIFVGIKPLQIIFRVKVISVHGGIVLVTEDDA